MRAKLPLFMPAVEQYAGIAALGQIVKPIVTGRPLHQIPLLFEIPGRCQNGGTQIAVNQGQLTLIIPNQIFGFCVISKQVQGIVGRDPAAAGGR